jgi:hypothetical protein
MSVPKDEEEIREAANLSVTLAAYESSEKIQGVKSAHIS